MAGVSAVTTIRGSVALQTQLAPQVLFAAHIATSVHGKSRVVSTFATLPHCVSERTERLGTEVHRRDDPAFRRSRRDALAITAGVLATSTSFSHTAHAEDEARSAVVTSKAYFDIAVDGVAKVQE